eukprot:2925442-Alexandrium_andersonii.AAC.1
MMMKVMVLMQNRNHDSNATATRKAQTTKQAKKANIVKMIIATNRTNATEATNHNTKAVNTKQMETKRR